MAQDQLRKPQPTRGTRGGAFAYCGSHLSHAEPQFTPVYRSRHPRTPQGATKPFTAENSPDHLNYYGPAYSPYAAQVQQSACSRKHDTSVVGCRKAQHCARSADRGVPKDGRFGVAMVCATGATSRSGSVPFDWRERLKQLPHEPVGSAFPPSAFVAEQVRILNKERVALLESQPSLGTATLTRAH